MNVNLYGCNGKWLMVDCGITFADPHYPGIDVILPDLAFIEERLDDLVGIVLTNGNEDHIGDLPYLAEELGVPLYATPFTAVLIRGKLEEEGNEQRVTLRVVKPGERVDIGPFGVDFVPLSHSIPEANALLIHTPYGRVFHTGDWKLDEVPVLGAPSSPAQLEAIGDQGILALVCDSTNVFNAEASGSESSVREGLTAVVAEAKNRVLVTTFASNAARLHTLGAVAKATGRVLCITGRSLDRILKVSRGRIQNQLAARGVAMITERQAHVHVSGHPGRPELARMYAWLRPEILMPVHGEMRHLMEQARFGLSQGIRQTMVQTDGDIVRLAPGGPEKVGHAQVGRLVLAGDVILPGDGATS